MDFLKKERIITFVLYLIPFTVSLISAVKFSAPLMLLTVILNYIVTAINPFARKRECLYMLPLITLTATPIILSVINFLIRWELIFSPVILVSIFIFFIMLSIIEIVLEVICRFIWKRQYKLTLYK